MITILGGGIAGLAAQHKLHCMGLNSCIYERSDQPGGVLQSFKVGKFCFDQAIHLSFAEDEVSRSVFDREPHYTHNPESMCFDEGIWLRHPAQNNLSPLPVEERVALVQSFIDRPNHEIKNYEDWLNYQYGILFAKRFPIKYTKKYWGLEANELGIKWIGNRMHRATLEQVLRGAMSDDVPNYYYAKEMRYPKDGPYFNFLQPLLKNANIQCNKAVARVSTQKKCISFQDKSEVNFDKIISTIPLPLLIQLIEDAPEHLKNIAAKLRWTKVCLVSFGFKKQHQMKQIWSYIYDDDILSSRVYSPSSKSPSNAPKNASSLQFEIYIDSHAENILSNNEYLNNCAYALEKMKLADLEDIQISDVRWMPYGNVTFYDGMEEDRDTLRDWLVDQGIELAGRFGAWEYLWSHQALLSGFDAAERVRDKL